MTGFPAWAGRYAGAGPVRISLMTTPAAVRPTSPGRYEMVPRTGAAVSGRSAPEDNGRPGIDAANAFRNALPAKLKADPAGKGAVGCGADVGYADA